MDNEITLKFIGYTRKSSEDNRERQAASLPDQIYILEGIKAKHNLNLIEILEESKSAHKPGREIFQKMIDRISKSEANSILTWHPNRLARNMSDGGQIIFLMDEGKLLEIRTPSRIYRNTPEDKFMLSLEFSISKKDSDDKSIVVKRGLDKKCRDGWRPGEAPFGYLNDKFTAAGQRKIFTDKERFPFIKKIYELFLNGTSVKEIRTISKNTWHLTTRQRPKMGGRPLSISNIYVILNEPFYFGKYEYPLGSGNWYIGKHERAISKELFNQVQVKLGHRSQYKLLHHDYAYTSLMKCGYCNSSIVGEEKNQVICSKCKYKFSLTKNNKDKCTQCDTRIEDMKKPTILHYVYYRCGRKKKIDPKCNQKGLNLEELEKQVGEELSQLEISYTFMNWAIKQIHKMNDGERGYREDTVTSIKKAHDDCRAKIDNLLRLKISPSNHDGSLLSDERFKEENNKLEVELKSIEKQLTNIDSRMIQSNEEIAKAFTFAATARLRFSNGDTKTKRDIFSGLGLHLKLIDKKVRYDSLDYMVIIKRMKKEVSSIGKIVAPSLQSVPTKKMEALWASNSILLRSRELRPV